ncbi:hypothetical protein [Dactylosporangium fulvum]|uniref:Uncharacterized protein n=1 Tax=Dactylosporangium fulvum TaxID=53359 RepID=A0ABY5VZI5_9ACTN|nr:hypothetical protein [Dactylosporangium fulvum]UWP82214.1 hypothetical protein Dfulv_45330 [Dactylosporangium fulvum]
MFKKHGHRALLRLRHASTSIGFGGLPGMVGRPLPGGLQIQHHLTELQGVKEYGTRMVVRYPHLPTSWGRQFCSRNSGNSTDRTAAVRDGEIPYQRYECAGHAVARQQLSGIRKPLLYPLSYEGAMSSVPTPTLTCVGISRPTVTPARSGW